MENAPAYRPSHQQRPSASAPAHTSSLAASRMNPNVSRRQAPAPPSVPYQVDLSTAKTGRHLSPTKRRVKFSFGLASLPHLGLGCIGADARGYEHECLLLWSLASGKRRILLNGREVHFSVGPIGQNSFSASFPLPGAGNHLIKIVADLSACGAGHHPSATLGHASKHFDLLLDGQSFHEMLKIYELGGPKCRSMYSKAMQYAESLPQEQLEKAARDIGTARGEHGGIRRAVPDRIVEHYEDATYVADELESSGADFDSINPKDRTEEQFMYEFARQKSLRNGSNQMRRNIGGGSGGLMASPSSAPPPPPARDQIPSFGAVHGAFRSGDLPQRQQSGGVPMRTIDESEDLIDLSSNYPTSQMPTTGPPPSVTRTPSDITIDMPDQSAADDVSVIGDDTSVVSGWGTGPQIPPSPQSFAYAPPPTWEDACWAFGAGAGYGQQQQQQQPPPPMAPPAPSVAPPPAFAVPPSVAPTSTYAPTDASFAARAAPNMPGSGASFAFAPPPTWEDVQQAQYGSTAAPPPPQPSARPPPPSGQWQQQQQTSQYGGFAASPQSKNPFSPAYSGI